MIKRGRFFAALASAVGAFVAGAFVARSARLSVEADAASQGMMTGGMMNGGMMSGGMMGHATAADMRTYMDMFMHHSQIQRTVEHIPGGVRTVTQSENPRIAAQLQTHVSEMYAHVASGQEVRCMSPNLPLMFRKASAYQRRLQLTPKGVSVTEISSDPRLVPTIRAHADEITSFVNDGMPAMMREMM